MVTQPNPYPQIVRTPGTVGGRPRVAGTRLSVDLIVEYYRINDGDVGQILEGFPHLTREGIAEALAFYADNRAEIDGYITENDDV